MAQRLPHIARYLLGLIFFVFGLNGFLQFIPAPPPDPKVAAYMTGLMSTGYFFPLLKGTETLCGALLLGNRYVPLALVVLTPILVQIAALHAFLAPSGLPLVLVILAAHGVLTYAYRDYFRVVLTAKAEPKVRSE